MIKLIEKTGEVSRALEFDTVAELVEYERSQDSKVDYSNLYGERSIKLADISPFLSTWTMREKAKGAATNDKGYTFPAGYVPFINTGRLKASLINHKAQGETVIAASEGNKYLLEVNSDQLCWGDASD